MAVPFAFPVCDPGALCPTSKCVGRLYQEVQGAVYSSHFCIVQRKRKKGCMFFCSAWQKLQSTGWSSQSVSERNKRTTAAEETEDSDMKGKTNQPGVDYSFPHPPSPSHHQYDGFHAQPWYKKPVYFCQGEASLTKRIHSHPTCNKSQLLHIDL